MKRILVTGGTGLLGSHLCEELLAQGNLVLCVDSPSRGRRPHLDHLLGNSRFQYLGPHPGSALVLLAVDEIYHFPGAALAPAAAAAQDSQAAHLLELARRTGATLLVASNRQLTGATDPAWEAAQERLEKPFLEPRGPFPIRVVRTYNAYGPRMLAQDGGVLKRFLLQALNGEPLILPGSGPQTGAFCYVDDLVAGLITVMAAAGAPPDAWELGNPEATTMTGLAQTILRQTGSRSPIIQEPPQAEPPRGPLPDLARAPSQLGWRPKVPLEDGLRWTLAYLRWLRENVSA